jgi:RHS repeat-associated protein
VAPPTEVYTHDLDGNLATDGRWAYTWDGENRLKRMETRSAAITAGVPRTRLDFAYDAEGRRTQKSVLTNWNGSVYQTTNVTRFLYDPGIQTGGGWNLLAEVDGANNVRRSYAWGLDLMGTLETEGNIGGLLMVVDHTGGSAVCHFAAYDGNGNLTALVKTDQTVAARYEYGPFGEPIRLTGALAKANPFRWSTKFTDEESGLVDYGYRLYSSSLGRWMSRDPIEEEGGNSQFKESIMVTYSVSLNIVSRSTTLKALTAVLRIEPDPDSPERGQTVPPPLGKLQKRFACTCWRLESGARKSASLRKHLDALLAKVPADLCQRLRGLDTRDPMISIGIFTDQPTKHVLIPTRYLRQITSLGCDIELAIYQM